MLSQSDSSPTVPIEESIVEEPIELSIIVVSWNVHDYLKACLQSLFTQTKDVRFEVLVVDNASNDGSADMVAKEFPDVTLIHNYHNRGFGMANNQALTKVKGEYILFLNDDTEIHGNIFHSLLTQYKDMVSHGQPVGMLGCQLRNPDNSIQPSVRAFPTVFDQTVILLKLHHVFPGLVSGYHQTHFDYTKEQTVDQVMGAFMFTTKSIIDEVGNFDSAFFNWFEEVDLQRRMYQAGYDVVYTPSVHCTHVKGASFTQLRKPEAQRIFNKSMRYYFRKHHSFAAYVWISIFQPISILLSYALQMVRV